MFQILRRSSPESSSGLITPNKHSAIRGKNSHYKELRSSSTIITTFILFNSYGVGENLLHPPVLRKLARGYRNISPTDLWRGINVLIMLILRFISYITQ